jgi:hypothetical protein
MYIHASVLSIWQLIIIYCHVVTILAIKCLVYKNIEIALLCTQVPIDNYILLVVYVLLGKEQATMWLFYCENSGPFGTVLSVF